MVGGGECGGAWCGGGWRVRRERSVVGGESGEEGGMVGGGGEGGVVGWGGGNMVWWRVGREHGGEGMWCGGGGEGTWCGGE